MKIFGYLGLIILLLLGVKGAVSILVEYQLVEISFILAGILVTLVSLLFVYFFLFETNE